MTLRVSITNGQGELLDLFEFDALASKYTVSGEPSDFEAARATFEATVADALFREINRTRKQGTLNATTCVVGD